MSYNQEMIDWRNNQSYDNETNRFDNQHFLPFSYTDRFHSQGSLKFEDSDWVNYQTGNGFDLRKKVTEERLIKIANGHHLPRVSTTKKYYAKQEQNQPLVNLDAKPRLYQKNTRNRKRFEKMEKQESLSSSTSSSFENSDHTISSSLENSDHGICLQFNTEESLSGKKY